MIDRSKQAAVSNTEDRPLVTFALFAYNQEKYIREALLGAFAQTYSPLEIILSDDCSTDQTFEIMREMAETYGGPHKIILNRNPKNLNIGEHVNTIGLMASGDLIVLAAGDDVPMPHRTERLMAHWLTLGQPSAVICSDFEAMDATSKPIVLSGEAVFRGAYQIQGIARGDARVLGATTAVTKDVFTAYPPMDASVQHEDRVLPYRAMLLGGVVTLVDEKLVRYRVEGGISRIQAKSAHHFLYEYTPSHTARTLPDAIQRLLDLESISPWETALRKICLATIADHRARIELVQSKNIYLEMSLVKWLLKGSRPVPLVKLYLKLRAKWIFSFYYQIRHAKPAK